MTTTQRIEQLRIEAGQAGDTEMIETCRRALAGSATARRECMRIISDTQKREADQ